jgi:hypothetical protein
MSPEDRQRLTHRLRALMVRTVSNGCTEEEELAAARLVARTIQQLDDAAAPVAHQPQAAEALRAERESPEYRALLEKTAIEGLLKAAIQELALMHINRMAPPDRKVRGQDVEWIRVREMLAAHLGMMLGANQSRLSAEALARTVEELIEDGQLPARLPIPVGE